MILSARCKTNFINLFLIDVYWNIIVANYLLTNRLGTVHVSLRTAKYTGSRNSIL